MDGKRPTKSAYDPGVKPVSDEVEKIPPLEFNTYEIRANIPKRVKIALVTDIHDATYTRIHSSFERERPDIICIVGDLISWHKIKRNEMTLKRYFNILLSQKIYTEECGHMYNSHYALDFLKDCVGFAPTFYSLGNHEKYFDRQDEECVREAGAFLLDNSYLSYQQLLIGGLSSAFVHSIDKTFDSPDGRTKISIRPRSASLSRKSLDWLSDFEAQDGYKILLCHHPEYYDRHLKSSRFDLVLSGHAHGGQIRIKKMGLYAPGQGLFPKYISGLYDGRLLVSRGITNVSKRIPRIHNVRELVYVDLIPADNRNTEQV